MPRLSEVIDDSTPMTGPRIDVAARTGWLLRTSRSIAGLSLRQMSAGLRGHGVLLSATTLSRIEIEGQRSPAALDGYAAVLGLPEGALRSPVDILCRTFSYAPSVSAEPATGSLDLFSEAYEAVGEGVPTGGAWLGFARQHAGDGGFGLPRSLMEPHVRRLADEVERSVAAARLSRYEALALVRCSAYGDLLASVVREIVLDPDAQLVGDVLSAVSERPTPELLAWLGALLRHERTQVLRGASHALQNMLVNGGLGPAAWASLAPDFVCAWAEADAPRRAVLTRLCAALPPALQARIRRDCGIRSEPARGPRVWSRSRSNAHYEFARSIAAVACARLGHREEPLLARLLFEAMFDPRGVRMSTATSTLMASPFAGELVTLLAEARGRGRNPPPPPPALRVAAACHRGEEVPFLDDWLRAEDRDEFHFALSVAGRSGRPLPQSALERGLAGGEACVRRTLYAAGMGADPRLPDLARRRRLPGPVRGAAGWWAAREGRILT